MQTEKNQPKYFIIGIIIFVGIIIFAIISYIINLTYSATLSTTIAPSTAVLTIDGKTYKINQDIKLKPADNTTVTISAEGFETQEVSISLTKDKTTTLALYLIPEDGDLSWYYNRPTENSLLLTIGGIQAAKTAKEYAEKYPISTILPIAFSESDPFWAEYSINGGAFSDCKNNKEFCIIITDTTGNYRDHAIKTIQDKGFNPNDYEIIYKHTPIQPIDQSTLDKIHQQYGID